MYYHLVLVTKYRRKVINDTISKRLREIFDYILIDAPPSLGLITINTLTAADSVIIPVQCEFYALEGVSQLIETIKRIKKALNPNLYIQGIVMTMYDARTNLAMQVVDEVKRFFPGKVYKTIRRCFKTR